MFSRLSVLLIAILVYGLNAISYAQDSAPAVQTLTRAQASRILLRWEPSNDRLWLAGLQGGYYVERKTMTRNNVAVSGDFVRLTAQPIKPAAASDWSPYLQPDSVQHQALYRLVTGQDTVARGPGRSADSLNQTSRETDPERRFFFGLMAASQSYSAARLAALGYVDAAVQANERYVYRVVLATPPGGASVNYPPSDQVGLADYTPLPAPMRPKLQFERYYANLKWLHDTLKTMFVSYWIERSVNGTTFQRMNDRPYVLLSDVTNLCAYNDPVPKGRRTYYYRIIGKSPFDEVAVSPVSVGESKDTLVMAPRIKALRLQKDNRVYMSWQFPGDSVLSQTSQPGADTLLKSFFIGVSAKPDAQPVLVKYGISRNDTVAYIDNYTNKAGGGSTFYFTLGAVRQDGDTLLSASMFVERLDSIPPAAPTGLRGQIDGSGRVYLSWQPNEEPDLLGYKVFRSQKAGEEPSAMQDTVLLKRSEFIDQTLINSLNPALYYQVKAIDTRFNESALSAPFRLAKPDAVRPASPLFRSDSLAGGLLRLDWSISSSPDVVRQWLLRREADGIGWQRLNSFSASTTTATDNGIQPGKRYQYLLVAEDQAGLLSDSTAIRRIAIPASKGRQAPVLSAFNAVADSDLPGVRLSWSYDGSTVSEYQLYRSSADKPFGLWRMVSGLEQSTDDEQATQPGTYRYKIQAVFKDGNVSNWQSASAVLSGTASTLVAGQPYLNQTLTGLTLQVGAAATYQVPSTIFAASDGQPIAITILTQGMPAGLVALDQTLSGTPQQAGQYTLTVQGKTTSGYLISTTLPVTVGQPAITSGVPTLTVTTGQPFTYTLPDWLFTGGTAKPQITILPTNLPTGATATGAQLQGTISSPGTYSLTIQSSDSLGGQTRTSWQLFVNQPPQLNSPVSSISATLGVYTEWVLPANVFRDIDGQLISVRIRAAGIPAGMAVRGNALVGVPTTTGTYTLTLIAADDVGATTTTTVAFAVGQSDNQRPQLTMLAPRVEGLVGDSLRYSVPSGLFYDPDGIIRQITLSGGLPAGLTITGSSVRGTPTQAGNYTLTATATDDRGGSISCPIELTLAAITYTAGFQLTGPTAVCAGDAAVLTASGCAGSVQWSSGAIGQTITVTPMTTTTYNASCIVTNQATVAATPLQLVVRAKPAAPQLTGGTVCKGNSITLTASNCAGTVTWSDGSIGASLIVTPNATTSYSAICSSEACTSLPGSTTVLVDSNCPASEIYVNCGGGQVTDSTGHVWLADTESSPSSYLKSDAGIGAENNITGTNTTDAPSAIFSSNRWSRPREIPLDWAFPVANGTYAVNLYFAEIWEGCQTANCRLNKIYLEGNYIETVDVNATVGFRRPLRKTYTVRVSDGLLNLSLMGVTNSAELSGIAIVPTTPTASPVVTISAQPSTSLCTSQSVVLTANNVATGASVRWSTGATSVSIAASATGPYSLTVTSQEGVVSTGNVVLTAAPEPVVTITGNLTLTTGQSTTLVASSAVDGSRFRWNTGATSAALSVTTSGTYSVTAISSAGCQASTSIVVTNAATTSCVEGDPYQLTQSFSSTTPVTIAAQKQIATSGTVTVGSGANLKLKAPQRIRLLPGFKAKQGSIFNARIGNCP